MNEINLRGIVFNITSRCTLKCKLCVVRSPHYDVHYEYNIIEASINRIMNSIDYVSKVDLSGGEPFLHNNLDKIIDNIMQYKSKFDKILIFTNGTLLFNRKIEKTLEKYRDSIVMRISNYGKVSNNVENLLMRCQKLGIECIESKYYGNEQYFGGWIDYGDYKTCYNRSVPALVNMYQNCMHTRMNGCYTIHNGKMHWCVPCAILTREHIIKDNNDDYINLLDISLSTVDIRNKIIAMQDKKYIKACDNCSNIINAKRHQAGIQLT